MSIELLDLSSSSTLLYRALYNGKIETQTSYYIVLYIFVTVFKSLSFSPVRNRGLRKRQFKRYVFNRLLKPFWKVSVFISVCARFIVDQSRKTIKKYASSMQTKNHMRVLGPR